jgi:hypothetical protein
MYFGKPMPMKFSAWRRGALSIFSVAVYAAVTAIAAGATPNETARFLAGMPAEPGSSLEPLTKQRFFAEHARFLDHAWTTLEERQLSQVKAWSSENLKAPRPVLFYMFSGPDFLYANAFFPHAETYVMAGLELPGDIPEIEALTEWSLPRELYGLRSSLNSVLSYGFFITKDMRSRLYSRRLTGTLPVLFVFLARSGKTIESVSFVQLEKEGTLHPLDQMAPARAAKGVRITFTGEDKEQQTLYYFATDLSDAGVKDSGFLSFCEKLGIGDALLKSASYLPHSNSFSKVRNFLLIRSATIVEDDSGIPLKDFDAKEWDVKPFGTYMKPIAKFKGRYQPSLHELFVRSSAQPISFGIGYRWRPGTSNILLASKKLAPAQQASSTSPPKDGGAVKE